MNSKNNSSLFDSSKVKIEFELIEIYVIVIYFTLGVIANLTIGLSVLLSSNHSQTIRRNHKMPVIDFILFIMSINTIARLLIKSGLQILCLFGICIIGIPFCHVHGFLNSLLHYLYLWTLALFVQDRYIKYRAQHDYISKCSSLVVIVTLTGVIFLTSVHVCGPIWGFARYEFLRDEKTCSVNWKSSYSCSYLIFSIVLISSPANMPLILWTMILIFKTLSRRFFTRSDHRLAKDNPISVTLTSTVASSSMATLSKSLVMSESTETLSVILISLTFLTTSTPKNLTDAALSCTSFDIEPSLVFWASILNEIGCTLMVPLILLAFHPKMRSSICSTFCRYLNHLGSTITESSHQHENIYMSTRPTTSNASASHSAVTVI